MSRQPLEKSIRHLLVTAIALIALGASSCSRQLPTASDAGTPARSARPASRSEQDFGSQVVVTLATGASPTAIAGDFGATLLDFESEENLATFLPAVGQTPADLAAQLALDPRVVTSEQNGVIIPAEARQKSFAFDDGFGSLQTTVAQPAAEAIHLEQAHAVSIGSGVKVAILDTGIDPSHPMFAGRIVGSADFLDPTNVAALDMADGIDNDGNSAIDEAYGHGTHVAGIVMLTAPGAQLLVGRVLDADGQGDVLAVAAGIRWAIRNGAKVINLSLGTLTHSNAIQSALEYAENHGVIVVASAGNWGAADPREFPARSSHAVAVAASDATAHPAPFTSFGNFVALAAPGVAVRSAYPGNAYRLWSGTSMSAPFVTGSAALLLAVHPTWTPANVMTRLGSTASTLVGLTPAQQDNMGEGMLNAGAALIVDYAPGIEGPADLPERLVNPR